MVINVIYNYCHTFSRIRDYSFYEPNSMEAILECFGYSFTSFLNKKQTK